ncbi:TrbC/VirB2 family protein [Variovorax paradoxus]|uniref:TrbC/VirB2 family protein n=1 Tax=Variovorax paradoxus TaxID=34073 RepID=UPI003D6579AB
MSVLFLRPPRDNAPSDLLGPGRSERLAGRARLARADRRSSEADLAAASAGARLRWLVALACLVPGLALAGSPFATGANATQTQLVAILTPLAAVAVMVSGVMAWFGRVSWWWMVGVVLGTVLVFGGPQIVSWIRGMFGV